MQIWSFVLFSCNEALLHCCTGLISFNDINVCGGRWALLYGTILTNARAMGEFGAVSVISGNILGKTQTLTLFVESAYKVGERQIL